MNDTGLAVLSGIAQGIEKASTNLFNIQMMKYKLKQEEEELGLKRKVSDAHLKHAEFLYGEDAVKDQRDLNKAKIAAALAQIELSNQKITTEEAKNKQALTTYNAGMEMVNKFLSGQLKIPEGSGVKMGQFSITGKKSGQSNALLDAFNSTDNEEQITPGPQTLEGIQNIETEDDFFSKFLGE